MIPDIHKTVIVTGASQGIGAGLVKAFLDRRYNKTQHNPPMKTKLLAAGLFLLLLPTARFIGDVVAFIRRPEISPKNRHELLALVYG
jgi:hypothetical protein